MRTSITLLAAAVLAGSALTVGGQGAPVPETKRTRKAIAKAQAAVEGHLDKLKATGAAVAYVKDDAVESALPRHYLFSVLFRQYPVARPTPKGLQSSNLFAVDVEDQVTVLTDAKELESFFRTNSAAAKDEARRKTAIRAWLRLTQQYHQDGFYTFGMVEDATRVEGQTARGIVAVMKGGSGTLGATMTFDDDGKLVKVREEAKLRPGPRPICQASKLLDKDLLVRRMAEQDLLIMGTAAGDYLDEQRSKASPELQRAIDRLWQRIRKSER
jgi:hypothetical protein